MDLRSLVGIIRRISCDSLSYSSTVTASAQDYRIGLTGLQNRGYQLVGFNMRKVLRLCPCQQCMDGPFNGPFVRCLKSEVRSRPEIAGRRRF